MDKKIHFTIMGNSPLLTRNPASMTQGQGTGRRRKEIPEAKEEAEAGLYIEDGKFCGPGIGIRNGLVAVASGWKLPGGGRLSLKSVIAHVTVEPDLIPILDHDGKPHRNWVIDSRRVAIKDAGIIRSRPRFDQWMAEFDICYDDEILSWGEETVKRQLTNMLNDAGKRMGWGDYRPAKLGWFGIYFVVPNGKA